MLIPFLYRSTKRQRSAKRRGERGEEIWNEEEEVEKEERGKKSQVCSIHKKKENELIVALTATTV